MKILIAEDDQTARFLLERILRKNGYDIITVKDGEEAWSFFSANEDISMVITDWMMPKMDGVELCQKIRDAEKDTERYSYILILTAKSQKEDLISALDAGADDYISKPYEKGELLARIQAGNRILNLKNQLVKRSPYRIKPSVAVRESWKDTSQGMWGFASAMIKLARAAALSPLPRRPICWASAWGVWSCSQPACSDWRATA